MTEPSHDCNGDGLPQMWLLSINKVVCLEHFYNCSRIIMKVNGCWTEPVICQEHIDRGSWTLQSRETRLGNGRDTWLTSGSIQENCTCSLAAGWGRRDPEGAAGVVSGSPSLSNSVTASWIRKVLMCSGTRARTPFILLRSETGGGGGGICENVKMLRLRNEQLRVTLKNVTDYALAFLQGRRTHRCAGRGAAGQDSRAG